MEGGPGLQVSEPRPEARLGLALRHARQSRGVSLRALARTLHRSHSTLVEYERGHRLAPLHVAHELVPAFPDIQLYVNLHGYEPAQRLTPSQVLDRFLRSLGVPSDALPADLDEQAARYRGLLAGRRALVVLDNTWSAQQVR